MSKAIDTYPKTVNFRLVHNSVKNFLWFSNSRLDFREQFRYGFM